MSPEEFEESALYLLECSKKINDCWQALYIQQNATRLLYLCKQVHMPLLLDGECVETNRPLSQTDDNDDVEEIDGATLSEVLEANHIAADYHVIYSPSYRVPVLYFNFYKSGGQLVSLDEVWSTLPKHYQNRLTQDRWSFLTQQEHPYLRRPFYQLHPCHTAELMENLAQRSKDKRTAIISWLSTVGPCVHLTMSLQYATCDSCHYSMLRMTQGNS